jgi:hypothetical protein
MEKKKITYEDMKKWVDNIPDDVWGAPMADQEPEPDYIFVGTLFGVKLYADTLDDELLTAIKKYLSTYKKVSIHLQNMNEKKCTCGDTETQHYENTDKCVVCGCKEFEEVDPVHAFFTAPEEVKRPVYERALQGAQKDQEQTTNTELRQEIIKTLKAVQDYCNR